MPEEEMVQAPVGAEEEKEPVEEEERMPEEAGNGNDLKVVVEELQDLVAEIVDVVDKLAESINAVKGTKEEMEEALKSLKKEFEIMKAELAKPGEADKERQEEWERNVQDEEKKPEGSGGEVVDVEQTVPELAPKPEVVETERPVTVEKKVVAPDEDIIDKILKEGVGVADLVRIEKSLLKR